MATIPIIGSMSTTELILVGSGITLAIVLSLVVGGVIKRIKSRETGEPDFDPKSLEQSLKPQIYQKVKDWGDNSSIKLRYGYDTKGVVESELSTSSSIEPEGKTLSGTSLSSLISIDEEDLKEARNNDIISDRIYNMITDKGNDPLSLLVVRDTGLISSVFYKIGSAFGKKEAVSDLKIVPERLITNNVDYLTIEKHTDFHRFAGMDLAEEVSVYNFVESIAFKNLYEKALRDQENYHEQVNFYNSGLSQIIQKEKAKAEAEASKYKGKGVGMVEEDKD